MSPLAIWVRTKLCDHTLKKTNRTKDFRGHTTYEIAISESPYLFLGSGKVTLKAGMSEGRVQGGSCPPRFWHFGRRRQPAAARCITTCPPWIDLTLAASLQSTLNIDLILWHTQLIVCAENIKSWFKSWIFPFTFQAYTMPHTLNCMYVSLFEFHIWILRQF